MTSPSPERADVVVAGAGMAGLCAAIVALEAGASVLVLEKGRRIGGTMWLSSGLIWTFRDRALLREQVPEGDAVLQGLVVDRLRASLDWLEARGVELSAEREFMWYGRGRLSDPKQMAPALAERVRERGGTIRLQASMDELIVQDGGVAGVRVPGADGPLELRAGAVVLATGGFQGNAELLQRYVTPYADRLYLRANPWSTGDGLLAATAAGAALTPNLHEFYGHALAAPPARIDEREFQAAGQRYGPVAVALNLDGRRFTDESAGTGEEHLNACIARERDATAVYVVDGRTADLSYYGGPTARGRLDWLREHEGPFVEAASLETLCEELAAWGVPPAKALETLRSYNAAVEADPHRLYPPRHRNGHALTEPPFLAVLVRPGITFTSGGLQVNASMQVLRRSASASTLPLVAAAPAEISGSVIPGLYAAGCDLGGFSGHGYMGGLSTALVTGRIAGEDAASHARQASGTSAATA